MCRFVNFLEGDLLELNFLLNNTARSAQLLLTYKSDLD